MSQTEQSPSTGESTKNQHEQEPARSDMTERPDVPRRDAEAPRQHSNTGPKSGEIGPKQ
jgi:hypothetical protein